MPPNQFVLAFDTSAAHCAVSLFIDGKCFDQRIEPMNKGQAERLFPLCEEVLNLAGISWQNLDAIGVCVGPGNFTGVALGFLQLEVFHYHSKNLLLVFQN